MRRYLIFTILFWGGQIFWLLGSDGLQKEWKNSLAMTFQKVDGVWISKTHVRNQDFKAIVTRESSFKVSIWHLVHAKWNHSTLDWNSWIQDRIDEEPVVGVSWEETQLFCERLTQKEKTEKIISPQARYRLIRDQEWSRLVGLPDEIEGSPREKNRKVNYYPWGTSHEPPSGVMNIAGKEARTPDFPKAWKTFSTPMDSFPRLAPVSSFPPNPRGFYDLPGNVMEWCDDLNSSKSSLRVIRGIPWYASDPDYLFVSRRLSASTSYREEGLSFRLVLEKQ